MANFAFQVTGAFQGNGQFAFQGATGVVSTPTGGGGIPYREIPSVSERRRRFLGLPEPEAQIIENVAARQAKDLSLDEQQKMEELRGEMLLRGIELKSAHFQALADERNRLIDYEIGERLRQVAEERQILAILMLLAASI
jgi:hypothetical protein